MILEYVKKVLGIPLYVYDFDDELLMHLNVIAETLVSFGINEFSGVVITEDTVWPDLSGKAVIKTIMKAYFAIATRIVFDPTANQTINNTFVDHMRKLEQKILVAVEEIEAEEEDIA